MRYFIVCLSAALVMCGCGGKDNTTSASAEQTEQKTIVYAQITVPNRDSGTTYYYYGEVYDSVYQAISTNALQKGFFTLHDIHYWDNDDVLRQYEDEQDSGDIVFRIEHLQKVERLKRLPDVGLPFEESEPEQASDEQQEQATDQSE